MKIFNFIWRNIIQIQIRMYIIFCKLLFGMTINSQIFWYLILSQHTIIDTEEILFGENKKKDQLTDILNICFGVATSALKTNSNNVGSRPTPLPPEEFKEIICFIWNNQSKKFFHCVSNNFTYLGIFHNVLLQFSILLVTDDISVKSLFPLAHVSN